MKINLINNLYIEVATDGNLTLKRATTYKSGKSIGEEAEQIIGYYNNVSSAVLKAIKVETANTEETFTLKEYIERYEKISQEIKDLIKS